MKNIKLILGIFLSFSLIFSACKKDNLQEEQATLPSKFKVDVPAAISSDVNSKAAYNEDDTVLGPSIYHHLRLFIHVGENGADLVEHIINVIRRYDLSQEMSFSFTSDEDNRVKNVTITANQEFENRTWDYKMVITDAENEQNDDGGIAMEIYWNTNPVEGIAIIKFANWNVEDAEDYPETMYRVEYSENPEYNMGYDEIMRVQISDLPIDSSDRFSMRNLMMFVGRLGDRVDVYGNSDHPNAWLFIPHEYGLDWAFVASASNSQNIGVAEVGLPPNTLNTTERSVILGEYSIKNVLTEEIRAWFYNNNIYPDSASLSHYLTNADAPGMFDANGFVQGGGTPPSEAYNDLIGAIQNLTPYNPYEVSQLHLTFGTQVSK